MVAFAGKPRYNIFCDAYTFGEYYKKGDSVKKKSYPTYRRRSKRKKHHMKKILTVLIFCVTVALCNGWTLPHSLRETRSQWVFLKDTFFRYIEENVPLLTENISETMSDAARNALEQIKPSEEKQDRAISAGNVLAYNGKPYVEIDGNVPFFSQEKKNGPAYEFYSELDQLGRCGYAEAKITQELMPSKERGAIGMIKPSGWHTIKYDQVDGRYLYNRCHLIGYQLTGENANEKNLITGTRYLNVVGMLPFENKVAEYVHLTGKPCMYRVTPVFKGEELVARGVEMEAESVEDQEISFHVFVYNVQPGIGIDYATGNSWEE